MGDPFRLRNAGPGDADRLAELIHRSTNAWYSQKLGHEVFNCTPSDVRLFVDTYEALDPGRCLIVEQITTGAIAGSCFVHARATHISLGILNVDAAFFGMGVARRLVDAVIEQADDLGLAIRLVSSAMNLDSYSLYTRAGFVPYAFFQDILIDSPHAEPPIDDPSARAARERIRPATQDDVTALVSLELKCAGIARPSDLSYLIANPPGCWNVLVGADPAGGLAGYLAAIDHPACRIIGPGCAADESTMTALLAAQLGAHTGKAMLVVAPAIHSALVQQLYRWGGRNCETHVAQCRPARGSSLLPQLSGVFLPTFLPETA